MIVNRDSNPSMELYYVGAIIISSLIDSDQEKKDFFALYESVKEESNISMHVFMLALDWLFLLGSINSADGEIYKCF